MHAVARYPFTRGGLLLGVASLLGLLPYGPLLSSALVLAFAIPVVRCSARAAPEADRMPRLLSGSASLPSDLAFSAILHGAYFAPTLLVLVLLIRDVDELQFLGPFMALPLLLQVAALVYWPGGVAVAVRTGHPFSGLVPTAVMNQAMSLRPDVVGYLIVLAWMLVVGVAVAWIWDSLQVLGPIGRIAGAGATAWYWLGALHLIGRGLRSPPETGGA